MRIEVDPTGLLAPAGDLDRAGASAGEQAARVIGGLRGLAAAGGDPVLSAAAERAMRRWGRGLEVLGQAVGATGLAVRAAAQVYAAAEAAAGAVGSPAVPGQAGLPPAARPTAP